MVKTKEMIFHRPNPKLIIFPNELSSIQRVTTFKLLGVLFKPDLNFNEYASSIVTVCNQRLYLLSLLRKQGLGIDECDNVLHAIVLSRLLYALPMFYHYLTSDTIERINAIFRKAHRWQLAKKIYDIEDFAEQMQIKLFQQSKFTHHCLNHLYVKKKTDCSMNLRQRGHDFELPSVKFDYSKKNFIVNSLFKYR